MARPVWSGSIVFGLVNVPVKAYTAVRDHGVRFHQLDRTSGSRIRYRKVAEATGEEVRDSDIRLGYEVSEGRHVTFTRDEVATLRPSSTKAIEVDAFVALSEIDPIFYERTYWLGPDGEAAGRPYHLLRAAMEDRERAGIGTVVMRNKQYVVAMRPLDGALAMSTMRFAEELVARADLDEVPAPTDTPDRKTLDLATQFIDSLDSSWEPEDYRDTYTEQLRERIAAKEAGDEILEEPVSGDGDDPLDLVAALERSVEAARSERGRPRTDRSVDKASA